MFHLILVTQQILDWKAELSNHVWEQLFSTDECSIGNVQFKWEQDNIPLSLELVAAAIHEHAAKAHTIITK